MKIIPNLWKLKLNSSLIFCNSSDSTCNFLISVHQLHPRLCFVQLPAHTRPLFKPTLFFLSGTASSAEKPLSSVSFSHPGVAAAVLAVIDTCEILFLGAKN
jgi:hypothetical protein